MTNPVPAKITQAGPAELEIRWGDGHLSVYSVVTLRRACCCAACVNEWTGARTLKPEDVADDVRPVRIQPVGRYAVNIQWSDGHGSGIYSFDYLRRLCPCPRCQESRSQQPKTESENS